MMKFLRSQSQTVLVVVMGLIALGFIFYGNSGNFLSTGSGRTSTDYGSIDGQDLTVADLTDAIRDARYSLIIGGHGQDLKAPGSSAKVAEFAWQQLLLQREAERLHITISDKELVDYVQNQAIFHDPKTGAYSPEMYEKTMGELRTFFNIPADAGPDPSATTKSIFENVFRNELAAEAISKALFNPIRIPVQDVTSQYQKYYGPATVTMVTFDPKNYVASAQVSPDEIAAEYKDHPTNPAYRTPEKRKVDYVLFLLSPDQVKLPDAQKASAKDALGQKALDFALAFQPEPTATGQAPPPPPDFMAEATKRSLNPMTTDFFAADTTPAGVPPSPAFNSAAFGLSKDNPISKVVELDNGVAVLHLSEIQPSELRPLEEVKADIIKQLQQSKGLQAEQIAAQLAAATLKAQVAKGAEFKTAATAQKLKVDTLPPFVPAKAMQDPSLQSIAYTAMGLAPGEVSQPVPAQSGDATLILHLDSRGQADPAGLPDFEARVRDSQDGQFRNAVSVDWASWKSKQPGTRRPPELDSFGSVE